MNKILINIYPIQSEFHHIFENLSKHVSLKYLLITAH